jgi:hypothetical protein
MAKLFVLVAIFAFITLASDIISAHPVLEPVVVPAQAAPALYQNARSEAILQEVISRTTDGGADKASVEPEPGEQESAEPSLEPSTEPSMEPRAGGGEYAGPTVEGGGYRRPSAGDGEYTGSSPGDGRYSASSAGGGGYAGPSTGVLDYTRPTRAYDGGVESGTWDGSYSEQSVEASAEESPEESPEKSPEESPEESSEASKDATPDTTDEGNACFPASAIVHLEDGTDVAMQKLMAGASVKVGSGLMPSSKVFLFSHKIRSGMRDFIRINSAAGHAITLTANHYIYSKGKLVAASAIKKGDVLYTLDGQSAVSSVESVREMGLFAPVTMHGDLVVNRVLVSSYTRAVHPRLAHALLAPARAFVHLGLSDEPLGAVMYQGGGRFTQLSGFVGGAERLSMSPMSLQ